MKTNRQLENQQRKIASGIYQKKTHYRYGTKSLRHDDHVVLTKERILKKTRFIPDEIDKNVLDNLLRNRNEILSLLENNILKGIILGKAAGRRSYKVEIRIDQDGNTLSAIFAESELIKDDAAISNEGTGFKEKYSL